MLSTVQRSAHMCAPVDSPGTEAAAATSRHPTGVDASGESPPACTRPPPHSLTSSALLKGRALHRATAPSPLWAPVPKHVGACIRHRTIRSKLALPLPRRCCLCMKWYHRPEKRTTETACSRSLCALSCHRQLRCPE